MSPCFHSCLFPSGSVCKAVREHPFQTETRSRHSPAERPPVAASRMWHPGGPTGLGPGTAPSSPNVLLRPLSPWQSSCHSSPPLRALVMPSPLLEHSSFGVDRVHPSLPSGAMPLVREACLLPSLSRMGIPVIPSFSSALVFLIIFNISLMRLIRQDIVLITTVF